MDESLPTPEEFALQLTRMLRSKVFRNAPRQAKLLSHLVSKSLADEPVTEDEIGLDLIRGYVPGVSESIRVTASHLRDNLTKYYATEGKHDLVVIDLPPGPGYRPTFVFNPRARKITEYRRGFAFLTKSSIHELGTARVSFGGRMPEDYDAINRAGLADAMFRMNLLTYILASLTLERNPLELPQIEYNARAALAHDPDYWHGHYVLAAHHACHWKWKEADESFARAVALQPQKANAYFWYPAFLLAVGRAEEALSLVRASAYQHPENLEAQITMLLFLHVAQRNGEVDDLLSYGGPFSFNPVASNNPLFRITAAMHCLTMRRFVEASHYLEDIRHGGQFPGSPDVKCAPGMIALIRAGRGKRDDARNILDDLLSPPEGRPDQLALAHMAVGEYREAIGILRKSLEAHNPLYVWLHLWPILDPLKEYEEFKELITRMNLPDRK